MWIQQELTNIFGFVFSASGISPDPRKVQAIHNASPPTSVCGVRSILGMANYCAKFIPQFSDVSQPLHDLRKKDAQFQWRDEHQRAFTTIKELLISDTVMAYYDQTKETELVMDASPQGLSAILTQKPPGKQDRRIVAYVSRSLFISWTVVLTNGVRGLSNCLSHWEAPSLLVYGGHFTLFTDCWPIQLFTTMPRQNQLHASKDGIFTCKATISQ